MLTVSDLTIRLPGRVLLDHVSFTINSGGSLSGSTTSCTVKNYQ